MVSTVALFAYKRCERTNQNLGTLQGMRVNSVYSNRTILSSAIVEMIKSFRQVDLSKIKFQKYLGQGNFGIVFLGKCEDIGNEEDEPTEVAVKTLNQGSRRESIVDFVREASFSTGSTTRTLWILWRLHGRHALLHDTGVHGPGGPLQVPAFPQKHALPLPAAGYVQAGGLRHGLSGVQELHPL